MSENLRGDFLTRTVNMLCVLLAVTVESSRVALQQIRGVEGSDYINASYIDVRDSVTLSTLCGL